MILSYLGALKTWVYDAVFIVFPPGPISLRLPTLLAGAATVWLFFLLLFRVAGRASAWLGALLLATDPSFLLNETIDFGPVAFHHLLKMGALLLILRFVDSRRILYLAIAFFFFGLAMWDKALYTWSLVGLGCATAAVYPAAVRRHVNAKAAGWALAGFVLGAAPLIVYNIAGNWTRFGRMPS